MLCGFCGYQVFSRDAFFPESLGPTNKAILHGSGCFRLAVSHLLALQLMEGSNASLARVGCTTLEKSFFLNIPLIVLKSKK